MSDTALDSTLPPAVDRTAPAHAAGRPGPSGLVALRPTGLTGGLVTGGAVALTTAGVLLSLAAHPVAWGAGQVVLAFAMVQWFAVLHECGHDTLFRRRRWNAVVGPVAGFMSLIPFHVWRRIHARHHKWTGWQDLDPTTAALVPRPLGRAERTLMNVCWRLWLPLFAVLYRINNFWSPARLLRLFPAQRDRIRLLASLTLTLAAWVALALIAGGGTLLRVGGVALLLAFVVEEALLLSQHTHIPQQLSGGAPVRPFPAVEQEMFTRSLVLPGWMSAALLHIDAHELHHMYPFVPGYHLGSIPYTPENAIGAWTWLRLARAMPGEVFLFQNRLETGVDL